ncbi:MAG: hypothetical protein ACP5JF_06905 [Candidatus Methanodesulfokora sp.]
MRVISLKKLALTLGLLLLLLIESSAVLYGIASTYGKVKGHWAITTFCGVVSLTRSGATALLWAGVKHKILLAIAGPTPLGWALLAITIGCA